MNASLLLSPLAALFGAAATLRGKLFDWGLLRQTSFPLPVLCVGNLAVGGTGKTPHVEHILRLIHSRFDGPVAMLSRGYGRRTHGFVLADEGSTAADIGDEPLQVMRNCPFAHVAVCEKRVVGIRMLMERFPDLRAIVLDDAFQHRHVKAGLNILLTDAHRLYTHDHFLPWGRLREAPSAARRAQVVVVTKCTGGERPALPVHPGQHLFYSRIVYAQLQKAASAESATADAPTLNYKGHSVLLLTGIANPAPLRVHAEAEGAAAVHTLAFPDHHAFTAADIEAIVAQWQRLGRPLTVTTQKDLMRLTPHLQQLPQAMLRLLHVQPITVGIEPADSTETSFNQIITTYVEANQRNG